MENCVSKELEGDNAIELMGIPGSFVGKRKAF